MKFLEQIAGRKSRWAKMNSRTPPPLFRSEQQLLAKLEVWLASRASETTIFDVISRGDGELLAAYILKVFRAAAR